MKYDLSILIPARNEMFVAETVEGILKNIRGNTEVIVVLDGELAFPSIEDAPNLTLLYLPQSIGQRAATNQACRLSKAKYVMKLDAHCVVDEGFDIKMLEDMEDNWTMLPTMYNLHAFDWVCIGKDNRDDFPYVTPERIKEKHGCGYRFYQGPTPKNCEKCGGNMERELIFKPRTNRKSTHYRFDHSLHFQYWGSLGQRVEQAGDISETMSAQGSGFLLTREKYWELNICDEGHGSWGQQGTEVACKTWLSGGRLVTTRKTFYSHMFRTQGGDFSFPYPVSGTDQKKAREYSRDYWYNNKFEKQIRPLSWLIERFKDIPDWHIDNNKPDPEIDNKTGKDILELVMKKGEEFYASRQTEGFGQINSESVTSFQQKDVRAELTGSFKKNIIYYTDNQLKLKFAHIVQNQLKKVNIPIVSASLKPMSHFGENIYIPLKRGVITYFMQIISALEKSKADIVYMCEADVIYHPSHFDFIPPQKDKFYYNLNFWRIRPERDNFAVHWDANQVSGLVCYRELVLDWYQKKLDKILKQGFDRSYEPGGRDKNVYENFRSEYPNIDIRHGGNLTRSKWSINDFRDKSTASGWQESTLEQIPGWDKNFLIKLT